MEPQVSVDVVDLVVAIGPRLAALVAHLDPPYGPWLSSVTSDARRGLGIEPVHLDGAAVDDLLLVEAGHSAAVVAGAQRRPLGGFLSKEEIA